MVATVYFPRNTEEFDYSKQFEPESSCETLGACKSQGSSPISNIKCLCLIKFEILYKEYKNLLLESNTLNIL